MPDKGTKLVLHEIQAADLNIRNIKKWIFQNFFKEELSYYTVEFSKNQKE